MECLQLIPEVCLTRGSMAEDQAMLYLKVKMEKCRLRFDICDEQVTVLQKNVKLQESGFYVVGKILRGDDLEKNKCRGSQRNLGLCVTCRKESVGGVNEIWCCV